MADASVIVAQVIFGLIRGILLGCVFALIALGLNLVWGIAKVVNIAHGELVMLGAYGAYFLNLFLGFNPLLTAPIDAALGLAAGLGFYFAILHRELRGKEAITLQSEMVTLVATFGLSLAISNLANIAFTGNFVGIPFDAGSIEIGFLQIPLAGIYVAVLSVVIISLTHVLLNRTYLGNAIRAYSQDIPAAKLMGINPTAVAAIGTGLAFAVTMAGGAFLTTLFPTGINPYMGALYAPISYVIVVLGGPGRMWGSLVGGLTLGIVIDVGQIFLGVEIAYAVAFLLLIPVLLLRPEGILR
ncbi:MAG: branched-chain amino acid ABC transporter permease [Candidatus Eisenbacteria bacterium]|uniref:Branched-chain amino acid ABC transporter permease n=1 Tax=Eiseniibacteriota bacterium TaxID=2212470 RepID=A0A538S6Q5_UNCEI|nr:MAG: branched-chain amino acid ABC transporter permease [Candidatus Eisenbacteria bacterium]